MDEDFRLIDNNLLIRMPTEIDHHKSVNISSKADRLILSKKVENVVFDFEQTTFMDSSGIGIIVGRYKKISCFGGAESEEYCFWQGWRILWRLWSSVRRTSLE